jgi:hypothetical protein
MADANLLRMWLVWAAVGAVIALAVLALFFWWLAT